MSLQHLPDHPDLSALRRRAKRLRDGARTGDPEALALLLEHHPDADSLLGAEQDHGAALPLAAAQLALARSYGFASWPTLRRHVDEVRARTRRPDQASTAGPREQLLRAMTVDHSRRGAPDLAAAAALLAAEPHLARSDLAVAAALGDPDAVRDLLRADPAAVQRESAPYGWPPLLHLCYSRWSGPLPDGKAPDHPAVLRLLLEAGADPNMGFLWDSLPSPFTALTGVFGGGEQGAPPHPSETALAELLLAAGADPNDSQTIYDRGAGDTVVRDDTAWLALLLRAGLGRGDGGPWHRLLAPRHQSPAQQLSEALLHAARHDLTGRARLLLESGADPERPSTHPLHGGRSPLREAVRHGAVGVARLLREHGARGADLTEEDEAFGALLGPADALADRTVAREMQRSHPDLVAQAAALGRPEAVAQLLDLGFAADARTAEGATALHEAAVRGDHATVELLLARGADPTLRDPTYGATPAGWARHTGREELAGLLEAAEQER
ncbi:ankyrin repeat domain-containing protein [Brachybacterium sp. J153]|uniref:ankyrin repeat domain-containing protein n=1 Tax=Brachybacterium sp. J153 TaxID=3116488 RepID=UPI002E795744|nr:ankyrin repeat domain-containing protein [Brachybacterium sp. J153]MEE1616885.1 ankyrin repeat domain-containing protein [Brachybacterium sp. J153]